MPIYEYYCPDNHTVYQFYARTLAQGRTVPPCPDNPKYRMQKIVSSFAVTSGRASEDTGADAGVDPAEDARMEAAMDAMEREFSGVDENDPRVMARMMRRMAELTGEKIDGEMEEVVRKLEEGADPESLDEQFGGDSDAMDDLPPGPEADAKKERRHRYKRLLRGPARRDPKLYDYP